MFGAIGRYLRAFFYLITGRIDSARKELSRNPYVIQATFERIIQEKSLRIHQYKEAVAAMIAQQEKKISTLKTLTDDVNRLERLKEGAAAKARSLVEELQRQGIPMDKIKSHEEYNKCLLAFNDFSSTLAEKQSHITELEQDIQSIGKNVGDHKVQLQGLLRDVDKLKEESAATVADVITAREEENISNMLAGISEDRFAKELQDMRDLRQTQKAKARVSRELAGTDTKRQEAEFLEYARTNVSTSEFDKLIGLAVTTDKSSAESVSKEKGKLPES